MNDLPEHTPVKTIRPLPRTFKVTSIDYDDEGLFIEILEVKGNRKEMKDDKNIWDDITEYEEGEDPYA